MMKWYVDKSSKMPLYLQLKDLILYYISSGIIKDQQKMPPVRELSQELGINYQTVRKALIELENEGILSLKQGRGTFVNIYRGNGLLTKSKAGILNDVRENLRISLREFLESGNSEDEARKFVEKAFREIAKNKSEKFIIFSECNPYQLREISRTLREYLEISIKPILVKDLKPSLVQNLSREEGRLLGVVTTPWHLNEIRRAIGDHNIYIDVLQIRMSRETREEITAHMEAHARIGCVCRENIIPILEVLVKAEFSPEANVHFCAYEDKAKVRSTLESMNVLLVAPSVYEDIKKIASPGMPIYIFTDKIDPLSLELLKQRISELK